MSKVPLIGGFYAAPSIIADAQSCKNLYPERNPEDSPFPFTHYNHPGLKSLTTSQGAEARCLYRASTGDLYACIGNKVYYVSPTYINNVVTELSLNLLGTIGTTSGIVSMKDNRLFILIVDNSSTGYYIDLQNNRAFGTINTIPSFYGSTRVDFRDTYFLLNQPSSNNFYVSSSEIDVDQIIGGPLLSGTIIPGSSYSNGTFIAAALTGGSGNSATADLVVASGGIQSVTINVGGDLYKVGDILSASNFDQQGAVLGVTNNNVGSGYINGTYPNVPLIGGTGNGIVVTLSINSGTITSTHVTNEGTGYLLNDLLSLDNTHVGGTGTGYGVNVSKIANGLGNGFTYTVTDVNEGLSAFDPLFIAAKITDSDSLVAVIAADQQIWLIGEKTSEIWIDSGSADFPFSRVSGAFVEHGCVAPYSIGKIDQSIIWLSQDKDGQTIVLSGQGYSAKRISTHAIENAFAQYEIVSDAIALTYQQNGHTFYQLSFPSADTTWVFDVATDLWSEKTWTDTIGNQHRHRAQVSAFAYGINIVGDWENGTLYNMSQTVYTDDGSPIVRIRSFPHLVAEGKRISYDRFIVEASVGTANVQNRRFISGLQANATTIAQATVTTGLLAYDTGTPDTNIYLRWSDTKGASYGTPIELTLGGIGDYDTSIQARNLGIGRDRVFELSWSCNFPVALNGLYIDVSPAET